MRISSGNKVPGENLHQCHFSINLTQDHAQATAVETWQLTELWHGPPVLWPLILYTHGFISELSDCTHPTMLGKVIINFQFTWEPQRFTILWTSMACYRDSFTLTFGQPILIPYDMTWDQTQASAVGSWWHLGYGRALLCYSHSLYTDRLTSELSNNAHANVVDNMMINFINIT
jgi:hypothetical protein